MFKSKRDLELERIKATEAAYRDIFRDSVRSRDVLRDLADFCYAHTELPCLSKAGHLDPMAMAVAEGRRQVWVRIASMVNIDTEALMTMKTQDLQHMATIRLSEGNEHD